MNRGRAGDRTFADAMRDFLDHGSGWGKHTKKTYAGRVNNLLREFGDVPLGRIDRQAIEGYVARRHSEGLSVASSNRYLGVMRRRTRRGS